MSHGFPGRPPPPGGSVVPAGPGPWAYAIAGLFIFLSATIGIFIEHPYLGHDPIDSHDASWVQTPHTGADRWWMIAVAGVVTFVLPWVVPVAMFLLPRPAIREGGPYLGLLIGRLVRWDQVRFCRWNGPGRAGLLEIRMAHDRASVSVPASHRAAVEAELRRLGRWRD